MVRPIKNNNIYISKKTYSPFNERGNNRSLIHERSNGDLIPASCMTCTYLLYERCNGDPTLTSCMKCALFLSLKNALPTWSLHHAWHIYTRRCMYVLRFLPCAWTYFGHAWKVFMNDEICDGRLKLLRTWSWMKMRYINLK